MELHTPKYVKVLQYVVMILMALFMFFPIYWIFVNSLKTITGISAWPPEFFPKDPQWGNYVKVLQNPNTLLYLRNTLVLVVLNTVGTLLTSSIVAYPLARMNFKGRGTVFAIILATMMVPSAALVIPQYLLFRNFGMLDSFWPLILPSFFAQPYNVFLFRQFFVSIPDSIDEAAMLDGCNRWQAFWKVIVPLGKPIFITVGIMSASFWWMQTLIMINYMRYVSGWEDLCFLPMTSLPSWRLPPVLPRPCGTCRWPSPC